MTCSSKLPYLIPLVKSIMMVLMMSSVAKMMMLVVSMMSSLRRNAGGGVTNVGITICDSSAGPGSPRQTTTTAGYIVHNLLVNHSTRLSLLLAFHNDYNTDMR